ncbi:MAG: hypothetical protein OH316_02305 [Candidatus Parvarchaeota archaeon]|nr:hypothetical protein [Candidatus Parvarchaeota archaeon]
MINYDELLAVILSLTGTLIFVSTSLFYIYLNRDKDAGIARIRLYRYSPALFSSMLMLNLIFAAGFLLAVASPGSDADLIGVLVYAVGISVSFLGLVRVILRRPSARG